MLVICVEGSVSPPPMSMGGFGGIIGGAMLAMGFKRGLFICLTC